MGAWGVGPLENDGALDLVDTMDVMAIPNKELYLHEKMLEKFKDDQIRNGMSKWERIGLLYHCLVKNQPQHGEIYIPIILSDILELSGDIYFINIWSGDSKSKIKKSLTDLFDFFMTYNPKIPRKKVGKRNV